MEEEEEEQMEAAARGGFLEMNPHRCEVQDRLWRNEGRKRAKMCRAD